MDVRLALPDQNNNFWNVLLLLGKSWTQKMRNFVGRKGFTLEMTTCSCLNNSIHYSPLYPYNVRRTEAPNIGIVNESYLHTHRVSWLINCNWPVAATASVVVVMATGGRHVFTRSFTKCINSIKLVNVVGLGGALPMMLTWQCGQRCRGHETTSNTGVARCRHGS